jgi:hypothetical protein
MRVRTLIASALSGVLLVATVPFSAMAVGTTTVYDATPGTLPPNVASLGYQATSTSQFGDRITLDGTDRKLNSVTVTMSDWALYADYASDLAYSGNNVSWSHPITVNIYGTQLDANGVPTNLLATKTITATIPWRPAADPVNCPTKSDPGYAFKYQAIPGAPDTNCYNGYAFNLTFDMSAPSVVLPNDVIVGVAFSTQSYGTTALGVDGPYNSLNVGVPVGQTATIGTDYDTDATYWDTTYPGYTAGFRSDSGWGADGTGTVAFQINADVTDTTAPAIPTHIYPANNSFVNVHDFTFTWSAVTDPSNPVTYDWEASYANTVSGAGGGFTSVLAAHNGQSTPSVYSPGTPDNPYFWHVRAVDAVGNKRDWSTPTKVTVDTIAPDVAITNPLNGATLKNTVAVKGTVTDVNPDHYYAVVTNSSNAVVAGPGVVNSTVSFTDQLLFNFNTKLVPNGSYTLVLEARDAAQNKDAGSVANTSVTVHNVPKNKDDCKNNHWKFYPDMFRNQGQCVSYVEHDDNDDHKENRFEHSYHSVLNYFESQFSKRD